jgi:AAHS family 4-hydroxybenzoate transporter-like MFS transporter
VYDKPIIIAGGAIGGLAAALGLALGSDSRRRAALLLAPVLVRALPESVRYLVMKGGQDARIATALRRIEPAADLADAAFTGGRKSQGSPVRQLFQGGLLRGTLLLWTTFFMSLLVVYLLSSWLPTLIHSSGLSLRTAALITAMFQVGGTLGAIAIGRLMDAFDPHHVLGFTYAAAGGFVFLIGQTQDTPWPCSVPGSARSSSTFATCRGGSGGRCPAPPSCSGSNSPHPP